MFGRSEREVARRGGVVGLAEAVANGERDLTASFEYFRGSNRGLQTMARMLLIERTSFLFLLYPPDALFLFLLHRNRARYLLLRNCKPLEKNRETGSRYAPDLAFIARCYVERLSSAL